MIRFVRSHIVVLSLVTIIASAVCFTYLPLWRAWPEFVPGSLRALFIAASMPWSWITLVTIDTPTWKLSIEMNYVVSELLIAAGFGINVAVITAFAWFRASRKSAGTSASGQ
jgi:hypothetical protein